MTFIVKVQLSLSTTHSVRQMLVYNRDRTVEYEGAATDEVLRELKGALKSFYYARMKGTEIELFNKAPNQNW